MPVQTLQEAMSEINAKIMKRSMQSKFVPPHQKNEDDILLDQLNRSLHGSRVLETKTQIEEHIQNQRLENQEAAEHIKQLETSQQATQQTLEALLQHTNKYLVKLSNAVLFLKRDIEVLKAERLENMCECEANGECCCGEEYEECDEEEECCGGHCQCNCRE